MRLTHGKVADRARIGIDKQKEGIGTKHYCEQYLSKDWP
jgi:hypothetical protein